MELICFLPLLLPVPVLAAVVFVEYHRVGKGKNRGVTEHNEKGGKGAKDDGRM